MASQKKSFLTLRPPGFNQKALASHRDISDRVHRLNGYKPIFKCPICNGTESLPFTTQFGHGILKCAACNLVYADKHPKNFGDVYSNEEYVAVVDETYVESEKERIHLFGDDRLNLIRTYKPDISSLLDFGAGTGWFARHARAAGINVSVFEYSKQLVKILEQRYKLNAYSDVKDISEKYDVITLFDVIEHHPSPRDLLLEIKGMLRPSGIIIIFTPNVSSLAFRYLGVNNNLLCPPQHLFYFDETSISNLAFFCQLRILAIKFAGLDYYDINSYLLDSKGTSEINDESLLVELQSILDEAGVSNHMRVILTNN